MMTPSGFGIPKSVLRSLAAPALRPGSGRVVVVPWCPRYSHRGASDLGNPLSRVDYLALPHFVRTAPSSAMWIANRLAGSLALAFSLTK